MKINANINKLQRYKIIAREDGNGIEIVKADDHDTTGDIFTIETLESEFESLRRLDSDDESVFEIAEDILCRVSEIVDEPRADKLLRELDRFMLEGCDECFDENEWAK